MVPFTYNPLLTLELMDNIYNESAVVTKHVYDDKNNLTKIYGEFKRNNRTFCLWENEIDRYQSTNAILVTIPYDKMYVNLTRWSSNKLRGVGRDITFHKKQSRSRQLVFRYDSIWSQPHNGKMLHTMYDNMTMNQWLQTCTFEITLSSTLSSQEMKNFNVELVTSQILNLTNAPTGHPTTYPTTSPTTYQTTYVTTRAIAYPTASPTTYQTTYVTARAIAHPTASPSTSSMSTQKSDKSTIPMPYILVCVFVASFVFLSLIIYLIKRRKRPQEVTHETVTITMHEMKTREN